LPHAQPLPRPRTAPDVAAARLRSPPRRPMTRSQAKL
jgi:hypothetical protein